MPNLKFVSLDIFELLAFNAHKLRGYVTLATPPLRKNFGATENASPVKCNTMKMTDQIAALEFARPGK